MSDEELRKAARGADDERLLRLALRSEWESVVGLGGRVLSRINAQAHVHISEMQNLTAKIGAFAPLCHCGSIGWPKCELHIGSVEKYEEVLRSYKDLGLYDKWLRGQEVALKDAQLLQKAYIDAGCPGFENGMCGFPGCGDRAWCFCDLHIRLKLKMALVGRGR